MTKSVSFQVWTLVALIGHFSIHTRLLGWHSLKRCKMLLKDHAVVVNWPASILFLLSSSLAYSFFICQMTFSWPRLFYVQFFPRIERYNDDSQLLLAPRSFPCFIRARWTKFARFGPKKTMILLWHFWKSHPTEKIIRCCFVQDDLPDLLFLSFGRNLSLASGFLTEPGISSSRPEIREHQIFPPRGRVWSYHLS